MAAAAPASEFTAGNGDDFDTGASEPRVGVVIARVAHDHARFECYDIVAVIPLLAFGFGGIASTATGMAQILFVIALILFVVSLFAGFVRRNL